MTDLRESDQLSRAQAAFFDDSVDDEWEIDRPYGGAPFHKDVLRLKFSLAAHPLGAMHGRTVLVVCGGSGLDAEFLARMGADVLTTDISPGACMRARARAQRHAVRFDVEVANVLALPFPDQSFDVVYVHDGLHHLVDPYAGLGEMLRVARQAVSVTEPSTALITRAAIRLGLAAAIEEAGNTVARLDLPVTSKFLCDQGFSITAARRYALFYRHRPGLPSKVLSSPIVRPVANSALRLLVRRSGFFGNKLVVVATRL